MLRPLYMTHWPWTFVVDRMSCVQCTKFEWDRSVRGWVMNDVLQLFRRLLGVPQTTYVFWKGREPICTKFGENIVRSSLHTELKMVQISHSVLERERLKVETRQKSHTWPSVQVTEEVEEMSTEKNSSFHYDRTYVIHLTGGHCTVCRGEVPEKKYSSVY